PCGEIGICTKWIKMFLRPCRAGQISPRAPGIACYFDNVKHSIVDPCAGASRRSPIAAAAAFFAAVAGPSPALAGAPASLIYWLELGGGVHVANPDGSGSKELVPGLKEGPDGVAVDP